MEPWMQPSILQRIASGQGIRKITQSAFVNQLVDIYALIYLADEWEKQNGPIHLTPTIRKILEGKYDNQFKAAPKGSEKWEWNP